MNVQKCTYTSAPEFFGPEWSVKTREAGAYGIPYLSATHTETGLSVEVICTGTTRPRLSERFTLSVPVPEHLSGGRFGLPLRGAARARESFLPGGELQARLRALRESPAEVAWLMVEAAHNAAAR